jgi:starch synthase
MRSLILTREYPPHVYGGAGVHVEHLVRELARRIEVEVRCFGDQREDGGNPRVHGYPFGDAMFEGNPSRAREALKALHTCQRFTAQPIEADVVHCHTWYSHWGGVLAKLTYGVPLVVTVHSLEPLRPWKREQLGRGYDLSSWIERAALEQADAVIAVSGEDRREILERFRIDPPRVRTIPNGIDTSLYRPTPDPQALRRLGVDPDVPYVLFLGRITRQKGIRHFLAAAARLHPQVQVVLCAAGPDSPEIGRATEEAVARLRRQRSRVVWISEMVTRPDAIRLYSGAAVFCCPSIYEPFGIINLEAMACETPVVATAVGGIREVVADGETGLLVPFERRSPADAEPAHPERLAEGLARAIDRVVGDRDLRQDMGRRGRKRALELYGWDRIAERVLEVYDAVRACPPAERAKERREES